jgi:hypothetical protein
MHLKFSQHGMPFPPLQWGQPLRLTQTPCSVKLTLGQADKAANHMLLCLLIHCTGHQHGQVHCPTVTQDPDRRVTSPLKSHAAFESSLVNKVMSKSEEHRLEGWFRWYLPCKHKALSSNPITGATPCLFYSSYFGDEGLKNYLLGLASNCNPPNLSLPSS